MATITKPKREQRPPGWKGMKRTKSPNEAKYQTTLWRDKRKAFLERHGNRCVKFRNNPKCTKIATTVDHIDNASQDHVDFWNESNWRPMCKSCHAKKSNSERALARKQLKQKQR